MTYRGNNVVEEQTEYFDVDYSIVPISPLYFLISI